jgi:hypothetical protein
MKSALTLILLAAALSAACTNPVAPSAMPSGSGASAPLNSNDDGSGGSVTSSPQKMHGQPKIGEG